MEITTTTIHRNPSRRAAVTTLAVIGFIALLIIGIGLAIYTANHFPKLSLNSNGAAVSLSSIFHSKDEEPQLNVVTATTTLPIEDAVVATTTATTTTNTTHTSTSGSTAGTGSAVTTVVTTTQTNPTPYGSSDLTVTITDVGYLTSDNTSSFVSSPSVPVGYKGAVKFTVRNIGTNYTGSWKFNVDAPTAPYNYLFTSPFQTSLAPGDRIDYVLGFDHGYNGVHVVKVMVDSDRNVTESNENNNGDSRNIVMN